MTTSFRDAKIRFDDLNTHGLIPDGTTGRLGARSKASRDVIVSHVNTAIESIVDGDQTIVPSGLADDFDIEAYQYSLPDIAFTDARDNGRGKAHDRRSSVRTFCRAVFGTQYDAKQRRKTTLDNVPQAFHPLFARFFQEAAGGPDGKAGHKSRAAQFCDVMTRAGYHSLQALPADWEAVCRAFRSAAVPDDRRGNILLAYRLARLSSGLTSLPIMEAPPHAFERGLRTVKHIGTLVRQGAARRQLADPAWTPPTSVACVETMSTVDMLACIAPGQHDFAVAYLDWADTQGARVAGTTEDAIGALGCFTAELLRLGYDQEVFALDLLELFTTTKRRPRAVPLASATARKYAVDTATEEVSYFRIALEEAAKRSAKHSYKSLPAEVVQGDIPFVTEAIVNQLARVQGIVTHCASHWGIPKGKPAAWDGYKMEIQRLQTMIATINDPVKHLLEGYKNKLLVPITWAQAMFVGVPRLWRTARQVRGQLSGALQRHDNNFDAKPVQKALLAFNEAVKPWLLAMLFLEDAMRGSNYAYGRLNRNVMPQWSLDAEGKPLAIQSVLMRFTPAAQDGSRTKTEGAPRVRYLRAGLWDFELLADYILLGRREELLKCGKIGTRDEYNALADTHALLVNPRSGKTRSSKTTRRNRKSHPKHASYSPAHISKQFGKILHWMSKDVLEQRDIYGSELPTWKELCARTPEGKLLRAKWRALWNGHISRLLVGNYIGGYLELWTEALERTHHTKKTMQSSYMTHFSAVLDERRGWTGVENPEHFAELTRKVLRDRAILDWSTFNPMKPHEAKLTMPGEVAAKAA